MPSSGVVPFGNTVLQFVIMIYRTLPILIRTPAAVSRGGGALRDDTKKRY